MANLDWLKQAEKSENPEIQEMLVAYKLTDKAGEQLEIERKIKQILFAELEKSVLKEMAEEVEKPKKYGDEEKAPDIVKMEHEEFSLTLKDVEDTPVEKIGDLVRKCKEELKYMEKTQPKTLSPAERKSYVKRRTFIQNLKETAIRKRIDANRKEKLAKSEKVVSSLRLKQIRLIHFLEVGTSFTNIIRDDNGLKPDELVACMEEGTMVFDRFPTLSPRWIKWKQKKLKKTEKGYKLVG